MMAADLPLCYHGALSRKDTETMLGKKNKDGSYLIRDSETIQGAMCLCVYKKKVVYTYRLLKTVNGHFTLLTAGGSEELHFKSMDELIRHYKRKNQGLVMHLRHSVKRKTALLIQATTQSHRAPSVELLQQGAEDHQAPRHPSEVSPGRRSEVSLHQLRLEETQRTRDNQAQKRSPEAHRGDHRGAGRREHRGEHRGAGRGEHRGEHRGAGRREHRRADRGAEEPRAEPAHSSQQTNEPTEHEEVEYENLPDYVDVQPS